jgi:NADH-quinone oxidoreductase subunit F
LLESLEGKKGQPRNKPPFPGDGGALFLPDDGEQCGNDCRGADDFAARRARGSRKLDLNEKNAGTKLFCISGHVKQPCNVEEAMGIPLRELDR